MDIQTKIAGLAGMGATWVMWVLVALSVGGLALALERVIYFALTRDNLRSLKADVLGLLRKGDVQGAKGKLGKARSFEAQPETRAVIAADGRVNHAKVVRVIDLLRREDVSKFAFNVDPDELGKPSATRKP